MCRLLGTYALLCLFFYVNITVSSAQQELIKGAAEGMYQKGVEHYSQGNYQEAHQFFEKAHKQTVGNVNAQTYLSAL